MFPDSLETLLAIDNAQFVPRGFGFFQFPGFSMSRVRTPLPFLRIQDSCPAVLSIRGLSRRSRGRDNDQTTSKHYIL